jgi:DNA invertase Pin-like site-specific DNA recombinase
MTLPAIGGIRVSTSDQTNGYGPDRQREGIQQEADRNGLELIDWVEETISGADHDRAAENRYFTLARQRAGLNFIFSHPNRVGRHVEVTVGIAREIQRLGGTVWIAGLGNLRDARNWKSFLHDSVDAENEYAGLVSQMQAGKRGKALAGRWPHGRPPWGYVLARDERGRSTVPVPGEHAAAVRRVFELSQAQGYVSTLRTMQAEGWAAPTAAGWTKSTIEVLLTNARYTGKAVFAGVTLHFDPIIAPEVFEQLQAARTLRSRESAPKGEILLWSGHLRCSVCGGALGRHRISGGGRSYMYYRCWRAAEKAPAATCTNGKRWPLLATDEAWWALLTETLSDPARLPGLLPPFVPPASAPPPARVSELEEAIGRAWQPFAAGKVSSDVAERLAAPYVAELARLKQEYTPAPAPPPPDYTELSASLLQAARQAETFEERRSLLDALDVRLYVGPEGIERVSLRVL